MSQELSQAQPKTPKAEKTRALIAEAAMRLFQEHGYEATTMRAIAREAGVATGNAYYYFSCKEELIQEYFARSAREHAAACRSLLASQPRFVPRLRGVLRALIETQAPYRSFAATLYSRAADTASPLSPFSEEAAGARAVAVSLYGEVAAGSRLRVPGYLREHLPSLLWLYSVGIMLFWSRDASPDGRRTMRLIDATVPIAAQLITLSRLPVVRGVARRLLAVAGAVREPARLATWRLPGSTPASSRGWAAGDGRSRPCARGPGVAGVAGRVGRPVGRPAGVRRGAEPP